MNPPELDSLKKCCFSPFSAEKSPIRRPLGNLRRRSHFYRVEATDMHFEYVCCVVFVKQNPGPGRGSREGLTPVSLENLFVTCRSIPRI